MPNNVPSVCVGIGTRRKKIRQNQQCIRAELSTTSERNSASQIVWGKCGWQLWVCRKKKKKSCSLCVGVCRWNSEPPFFLLPCSQMYSRPQPGCFHELLSAGIITSLSYRENYIMDMFNFLQSIIQFICYLCICVPFQKSGTRLNHTTLWMDPLFLFAHLSFQFILIFSHRVRVKGTVKQLIRIKISPTFCV